MSQGDPVPVVEHYDNVEEFLQQLSNVRHRANSARWAFRGHGDADWPLVPSVLRQRRGKPPEWWHPEVSGGDRDWCRRMSEARMVLQFWELADRSGLAIPEDSARIRSWRHLERILGASPRSAFGSKMPLEPPTRWPQPELLSVVALAQHYGVKTRLLDWTWKPLVAAYFAARDVKRLTLTGRIAVWALWAETIDLLWTAEIVDPDVEIVQAPQASNPNLAAQAGLFTVVRNAHENVGLEDVLKPKLTGGMLAGTLRKLTLPASEARSLMGQLHLDGVHAGTVFAGYGGVVEAQSEIDWWSGAPRSRRTPPGVPAGPPGLDRASAPKRARSGAPTLATPVSSPGERPATSRRARGSRRRPPP